MTIMLPEEELMTEVQILYMLNLSRMTGNICIIAMFVVVDLQTVLRIKCAGVYYSYVFDLQAYQTLSVMVQWLIIRRRETECYRMFSHGHVIVRYKNITSV